MFDFLKKITFKQVLKYMGIILLGIVFLVIVLGIASFILSNIGTIFFGNKNISSYQTDYSARGNIAAPSYNANPWASKGAYLSESSTDSDGVPASPISSVPYEVKSYNASIDSKIPDVDCNLLVSQIDRTITNVENFSASKQYCNLTVRVKKENEQEFIALLKTFRPRDIISNISNIEKPYISTVDRIGELKKRLADIDNLLESTKRQYDELWEALKVRNVSPESIDSLNKIIINKSELISKFSLDRINLLEQIDAITKQKEQYDEDIKYVTFSVSFRKHTLFDFDTLKEQWFSDTRDLIETFNETIRNITVNLSSFLLRTFYVVIYIVLGAFIILAGGKFLYLMGRRILLGKSQKK